MKEREARAPRSQVWRTLRFPYSVSGWRVGCLENVGNSCGPLECIFSVYSNSYIAIVGSQAKRRPNAVIEVRKMKFGIGAVPDEFTTTEENRAGTFHGDKGLLAMDESNATCNKRLRFRNSADRGGTARIRE